MEKQKVGPAEISIQLELAQESGFKEIIHNFATLKARMVHKKYCVLMCGVLGSHSTHPTLGMDLPISFYL
jgi:hypothetical protein